MSISLPLVLLMAITACLLVTSAHCTSDYKVTSMNKNASSIQLMLLYTGQQPYYNKPTSPIIKQLKFVIRTLSYSDFVIKITDATKNRFQIPQGGAFPTDPLANANFNYNVSSILFTYQNEPFDFKILRKATNSVLFSTYSSNFIFSDFYIEIGSQIDSQFVYGIGQRFSNSFRKGSGKWTVFNRDRGQVVDNGTGLQTYGHYPVYLLKEKAKLFHINYLRTSNAIDYLIYEQAGRHYITYKVIGGILDFRFFIGEQLPQATIQKLNLYIGRSALPPFWSFGFHQCRWGYKDINALQAVIKGYQSNKIPLETIWSDIDYMVNYQDFTIDETRFPLDRMRQITDNYHYIPIIDAGIKNSGPAYEEGLKRNVYIKDANGQNLIGKVWPGSTTFVDFFHPNASQFWNDMLSNLYSKVRFSGVWLDMNEYANFCDGPCNVPTQVSRFDYSKDLPYNPGNDSIQAHTIPLNSTHYGNLSEANVHAFAAMLQTEATNTFLRNRGLHPFIITRSSTFGTHKYGFHWTGDNRADWLYLKGSIADNFNFQLYGIQMVGADICGFGGDTNEQLCARWFQLGALYPFARNHNDYQSKSQEAYALGPIVAQSAKINLKLRYSLLKYYYTSFVQKRGIGAVFKPVFFLFPLDNNLYIDDICDTQFLIGRNLMAAPILDQGATSRRVYFPAQNWFDLHTGQMFAPGTHEITDVSLTSKVPLYLREATGLLMQNTSNVERISQLNNRFVLVAAFRFDQRRSNGTFKVYESQVNALSIKDYNDDTKIELCTRTGCTYIINMILSASQNIRTLEFDISYFGGIRLDQLIILDGVTAYFDGAAVTNSFVNPIQIVGPAKITIPLNDDQAFNHPEKVIFVNKLTTE